VLIRPNGLRARSFPTRRQVILGAIAAGTVGCAPSPIDREEPGRHIFEDRIGGKMRISTLIVPEGLEGPAPMLMGLHDTGDDPKAMYDRFGWREECAKRGWVGIFPEYGKTNQKNDNVYIAHLAVRAAALGGANPRRMYIVGHGAGGRRAYAFACANPSWVAAIAAVSAVVRFREGDLGFQVPKDPSVSVLHLHGAKDKRVRVAGGPLDCGDHKTRQVVPLPEALQPWIDQIDGKTAAMTLDVPAGVQAARWTGQGRDVVRLIDPHQDHSWNQSYWTRVIADFFAAAAPLRLKPG
jgi:polyhydroxybutyrate depolymerase